MKALEKMVKRRYETASEFLTALVTTPEGADALMSRRQLRAQTPTPAHKLRILVP